MPHIILEYTNNLAEPIDTQVLFSRLHKALVEIGPFDITQIKSRAIKLDHYYIGSGARESVMIHLTVGILNRHNLEKRKLISQRLLEVLQEYFAKTYSERPCDITVDIREIEKETFSKAMNEKAKQIKG
jgi:5-carboxymethyl-2-hydroxymuconate isomerase